MVSSLKLTEIFRCSLTPSSIGLLLLDRLGIGRRLYTIRTRGGISFEVRGGTSDRFTVYELLVKEDYSSIQDLKLGDTVIDIGANIGLFTVLAAKRVGDAGKVVAIEPNPGTLERLNRNIQLNHLSNVRVYQAAVAGKEGAMDLHFGSKDVFASLHPWVDNRMLNEGASVKVECITLRGILERENITRVDLLKMDCEGGEYEIFDMMPRDLWVKFPSIAMEGHQIRGRHPSELRNTLESLGYRLSQGDLIYARRPKVD
jgi:FkbM family methyltransferase